MKALFSTILSVLFMTLIGSAQTITTDKHDYPPGSTAIISGTGFQANETVQLQVLHIDANGNNSTEPQHQPWTVTADGNGNVSSTWHLDEDALGATFKLTADGLASGRHAETTFTDANITFTATFSPTTPTTTVNVTYTTTAPVANSLILPLNNANSFSNTIPLDKNATLTYSFANPINVGGVTYICTNCTNATETFTQPNNNNGSTFTRAYVASCTAPTITNQPSNASITYGANASFTVVASGTATLSYQWKEDGTNIINGGVYSNATTATLTLTKPGVSLSGKIYTCVISNGCTPAATTTGVALTVTAKALTIAPATASPKVYDNNTTAIVTGTLSGVVSPDVVTLNGTGIFASKNVGTGIAVTSTSTLVGVDAGNYSLTQPTGLTANITAKALTVTANTDTKVYNGTTSSSVSPTVVGIIAPDAVGTAPTQSFNNKNVGAGKTLTASGLTITDGNSGNNYSISYVPNTTGVITAVSVTVTANTDTKVYNGTTSSGVFPTVVGIIAPDVVGTAPTQTYDNRNVGTGKTMTATGLGVNDGNNGNNYSITYITNITGEIQIRPITVTALTSTKVYDGYITSIVVPSVPALQVGDVIQTQPKEVYDNPLVGTNKVMTASGLVINDANSGNNYLISYATNNTGVITAASTMTTLITSAASVRYMDQLTMTAVITPQYNTPGLTGTVEFKIGSHSYGTASVVALNDGTGAVQAMMIQQVSDLPTIPVSTGYSVTAIFTSTNTNYLGSSSTNFKVGSQILQTLTVTPRNSSPYNATGYYTGGVFYWTTGPSTNTATVTLSTTIKDPNLPTGDLRGAKVTFYTVSTTGALTPIPSAQNLPVGLVNVADGSVGTASAIVQLNIGTQTAGSFQIAIGITGAYKNNPYDFVSQTIITVSKPLGVGNIVGGGNILNSASSGYVKGATDLTTHFEFDLQYNNTGTNPKGKVTIQVASYNKPDGTLDAVLHNYLITTNAIAALTVSPPVPAEAGAMVGTFSAKANIVELINGTSVSLEGGAVFQMEAYQNGCTGKIAITLNRKAGGIWFSSNWNGSRTLLQGLVTTDGSKVGVAGATVCVPPPSSLIVNNASNANSTQLTAKMEQLELPEESLKPEVLTTPSHTSDVLTVYVKDFNDGVATVRLYDLTQRLRGEWKFNVHNNIGQIELDLSNLIAGAYIIVVDDKNKQQRKTQKVVRIN